MKSFLSILLWLLSSLFAKISLENEPFFTPVEVADFIYYNGVVLTMDPANPEAEAMAVKAGKIILTGRDEEVLLYKGTALETKLVNLNGLTILPGFNDAHCHWFSWREHRCTANDEEIIEWPPLEEIMVNLSAHGWTSISELAFGWPGDGSIEHLNNALDLEASGDLKVRVNGYWGHITDLSMFDSFGAYPHDRVYSDRIRAQGVKLYVDHPLGISDILTQEETDALVKRAQQDGWQIAAHAVNISGVEKILSAYEKVLGNQSNEKYRYRIEHAVKVTDDQLNRMLKKGIIASFQLMGPPDWPTQESHINYISNTQPELQMRWRDFVEAGLPSVGSTDAPFNNTACDYNPFRVIYQGVTRLGYIDRDHAQWELNQRLTIAHCLKLMTIDGAYATGEDSIKGNLMPGKYADFVVVSENPLNFEDDPQRLLDIEVLQTVVGGEVEFCASHPCFNLCEDQESFDLDSIQVTVSQYLPNQNPIAAFDHDLQSNWGAGAHPPQWLQIDLLRDRPVAKIDLTISQFPNGQTTHQILGASTSEDCALKILYEFKGSTEDGQILTYEPEKPDTLRFIRILTTESPSWVAWFEIGLQYADQMATSILNPSPFSGQMTIFPNPARDQVKVALQLRSDSYIYMDLLASDGSLIQQIDSVRKLAGYSDYLVALTNLTQGLYFFRIRTNDHVEFKKFVVSK